MKVKVSEATNIQLNWMVAKAQGIEVIYHDDGITRCVMRKGARGQYAGRFNPTTDWSQGGPTIERNEIYVRPTGDAAKWESYVWGKDTDGLEGFVREQQGPTPLIAAMRCFVAYRLGEEVEVPDGLA
jgi:hypothetical protein